VNRYSLEAARDEAYRELKGCLSRMVLGTIEETELWNYVQQYAGTCAALGSVYVEPEIVELPEETPLGEALDQGTEPEDPDAVEDPTLT
jgi:hypothetical protein